ncbi:MAG TPA: hypothetical protein VHO28_11995 [Ignavibacteriales bacterium]|nr:hypothetical protein [Ignavibacteriales bacterium]
MFRFKYVLPASILLLILIAFTGCNEDSASSAGPGPYQLEKPTGLAVQFRYNETSREYSALIRWLESAVEHDKGFTGYAVVIYEADFGDSINYTVIDSALLPGPVHSYTFTTLTPDKQFFAKIYTVSFGIILSAPLVTDVYNTKRLAPPENVSVAMNFDEGYSVAIISWTPSPDEALKDFEGYVIKTYEVTKEGEKGWPAEGNYCTKDKHSVKVRFTLSTNLRPYFRSYVSSKHTNDYRSPEAGSYIYGEEILDSGKIDEINPAPEVKSAYGWNNDAGTQYAFNSVNINNIDICCVRKDGQLFLYSPSAVENVPAGARQTKFLKLGKDFWERVAILPVDPIYDKINISEGDVILLMNQDNHYVKLKIKSSAPYGSNSYSTVAFDYRFQTIQGLRAAKQ